MMSFPRYLGVILLLGGLTACQSTYSEKNITKEPPPLLRSNTRAYVAIPFDAMFKKTVAQGSGKQTAQALFVAFNRYTKSVYLGKFPESTTEALDSARKFNAEYLVYPNIVKWEDRATEWSGRRDRLSLKVDLIDLSTSTIVFSREIEATGKWMTDGGDSPNDLLEQPCEEYVNALFRRIEKPSALW
ncbi:MAG TPA: DUF4823 domain-containing protein [Verrucomicrobiae bacterium]|nr:DUF4823 domain-containing protein [Verrucomicrobiae bacterium]